MNVEEDGTLSYSLNSYPSHSEHSCIRNGFENYMERGVMKMYQLVQENPHLEVPQIYNSVRQELSELFQGGARMLTGIRKLTITVSVGQLVRLTPSWRISPELCLVPP